MHWYKYSTNEKDFICHASSKLNAELKVRFSDEFTKLNSDLTYKGCVAKEKVPLLQGYTSVVIIN